MKNIGKYSSEKEAKKYAEKHEKVSHGGKITCAIEPLKNGVEFSVYCYDC